MTGHRSVFFHCCRCFGFFHATSWLTVNCVATSGARVLDLLCRQLAHVRLQKCPPEPRVSSDLSPDLTEPASGKICRSDDFSGVLGVPQNSAETLVAEGVST
jgi:hypothetical protein